MRIRVEVGSKSKGRSRAEGTRCITGTRWGGVGEVEKGEGLRGGVEGGGKLEL